MLPQLHHLEPVMLHQHMDMHHLTVMLHQLLAMDQSTDIDYQ
jgi:hypothetical protein